MNPILQHAIRVAEGAYADAEKSGLTPSASYDYAWDHAFEAATADGLRPVDAAAVATSAASDGAQDDPKGYKDLIAPHMCGQNTWPYTEHNYCVENAGHSGDHKDDKGRSFGPGGYTDKTLKGTE
jgi:hypothetical protein